MRIFSIISCKPLRGKNPSVRYHLGILKCRASFEGLFKSEVSFENCKGCLKP